MEFKERELSGLDCVEIVYVCSTVTQRLFELSQAGPRAVDRRATSGRGVLYVACRVPPGYCHPPLATPNQIHEKLGIVELFKLSRSLFDGCRTANRTRNSSILA